MIHTSRTWLAPGVASLFLFLIVVAAAQAQPARRTGAAVTLGHWNGIVTLSTVVNDTSILENTTTALEQLSFVIHDGQATETGSAKWRHGYSDACGGQVDSWYWSLGGAPVTVAVTVADSVIEFRVQNPPEVEYNFHADGAMSLTQEQGGTALCDTKRNPPAPAMNGTGDPGFDINVKSERQYLLRTSGRFAAKDSSQTLHASGGTVGAGTTTVTWNLIRSGPDKDHDGLADPGDAHPNNADADGDGYPDGWEQDNGTSPVDPHSHPHTPYRPGAPDSDHDGWSDYNEINQGTDPNDSRSHPPGRPDSPPAHPLPPGKPPVKPPVPPIEQHTNHEVIVPSTITCEGGVILTQRCHGILSPNATKNLNAEVVRYTVPTLEQERAMCTRYVVIPDIKQCIASNLWSFGTQASFKLGLSIAARAGKCFFFDLSRRKIGNLWSGAWERDYNQGDYEMNANETRMFGAVLISCGKPDANSISRLG